LFLQYQKTSKHLIRWLLVFVLVAHTALLGYSAYVHSPVVDEPAYMVAGLSHWKFGRFELYRVNPPLVRMVAVLPVMAAGYEGDWSGFYDSPGARPVFSMGENFVSANGERSFFLFMLARWACIPFSWIGASVCYLWARDLFGKPAGLVACALWCFSPNILGHASLMATDAHATSFGVAASYLFWRWLKRPTWVRVGLMTTALGLAQLAKTTLILFYPLWLFLWLVYRWPDRRKLGISDWLRQSGMLAFTVAGSLYILNMGYGFEGSFQLLKEFHFVSDLFTGSIDTEEYTNSTAVTGDSQSASKKDPSNNRFADSWLGELPVPFPEHYLKGIDIQQRDFEGFTFDSYLRGKFRDHGWWYYYLYAITIKVPLGTWLLGLLIVVSRLNGRLCGLGWRDKLGVLLPALFVFAVASSKSGFSHHMHYVLICFPFIFIWLSQIICLLQFQVPTMPERIASATYASKQGLASLVVVTALCWSIVSSIWIYPHSLSYFNEFVGGPTGGPKHLLHSNVDWGQDLRYLKWYLTKCERPVYLAYFGKFNPWDVGLNNALPWRDMTELSSVQHRSRALITLNQSISHSHAYNAISTNLVYGYGHNVRGGDMGYVLNTDYFSLLRDVVPDVHIGYSISLFASERKSAF